jgi:DNA-directed RNA polymerase specialized sigma24 family protein
MRALTARLHPALPVPRRLLRLRSDAALVERFAAGDEDAFAVLYERHRATVLAVSMGVLGSRDDAEDAVQDSFAALASSLRAHPPRDLRAWLIRVARNAAIDVGRRAGRSNT